jgi:uncharacterized protein (DUF1697 family)
MQTYIALLRGINVGGHKKILMSDLRDLMGKLDFHDVQTYIQSGNIIFRTENPDPGETGRLIEQKILERFGFEVPVLVKSPADLEYLLKTNPFPGEYPGEEKGYIYMYYPGGFGKSKININYFEKKLGVRATTRNWKTVNALHELAISI